MSSTEPGAVPGWLTVVDKSRLGRRLGSLKPATMALVNEGLAIVLALVDI
jgi:hypothetical protein